MKEKWEINRRSTPEHIFNKINKEMPQPVGIVLFGADCEFKNVIGRKCIRQIPNLVTTTDRYRRLSVNELEEIKKRKRNILYEISGRMSDSSEFRRQAIDSVKCAGAKTVIGIYAKRQLPALRVRQDAPHLKNSRSIREAEMLEKNPPTIDEVDYLVIVEEGKEE